MYGLLLLGWSAAALAPLIPALSARSAWPLAFDDALRRAPQPLYDRLVATLRLSTLLVPLMVLSLHIAVVSHAGVSNRSVFPIRQTGGASSALLDISRVALVTMAVAWIAGMLVAFTNTVRSLTREHRLRRDSADASPALIVRLEDAARQLGLAQVVKLRVARVDSPMVVGRRDPVILVPQTRWWTRDDHADALLLHELAHLQRGDARSNVWIVLASVVLWWHPAIRRLIHDAQVAREFACDDMAAAAVGSAATLADALVILAERRHSTFPSLLSLAAAAHPLLARLQRLCVDPSVRTEIPPRAPSTRWRARSAQVTAAALCLGVIAAVGNHDDTQRAFARSVIAPSSAMTIRAHDDAGAFEVIMRRGLVEGVVIDADSVTLPRLVQRGDSLRVHDLAGRAVLTLAVDPRGAIAWDSRRRRGSSAIH